MMGFTAVILLLFAAWAIRTPPTRASSDNADMLSGLSFAEARRTLIF